MNLRQDGRTWDALRPVRLEPAPWGYAEGSVWMAMGNTVVWCAATIEDGVPRWMQAAGQEGGWITAEYALLPRSTLTRTPRQNYQSSRSQEIRRLIGRSLRAAFDLSQLGPRTCIVDCDVLQADGGTRTAAITGGYVALALALQRLVKAGDVPSAVFRAPVAAVSVGVVDGQPLLDLAYAEDVRADVDMNVVMTTHGDLVEVQGTAEGRPFDRTLHERLLDLAWKGIQELLQAQQALLA